MSERIVNVTFYHYDYDDGDGNPIRIYTHFSPVTYIPRKEEYVFLEEDEIGDKTFFHTFNISMVHGRVSNIVWTFDKHCNIEVAIYLE